MINKLLHCWRACSAHWMRPGWRVGRTLRRAGSRLDRSTRPAGSLLLEGSIYRSTALAARLLKSADQALASGVATVISFQTANFDPAGMFDPAAPERLTARHAGPTGSRLPCALPLNPVGHRQALLRLNGFETLAAHTLMSPGGADGWLTLGGLANLQEGEYAGADRSANQRRRPGRARLQLAGDGAPCLS